MDAKGKTKTVRFGPDDFEKRPAAVNQALMKALKIKGKAVVRRPDGSISYSDPDKAGTFGEENLK